MIHLSLPSVESLYADFDLRTNTTGIKWSLKNCQSMLSIVFGLQNGSKIISFKQRFLNFTYIGIKTFNVLY